MALRIIVSMTLATLWLTATLVASWTIYKTKQKAGDKYFEFGDGLVTVIVGEAVIVVATVIIYAGLFH